MLDITLTPTIQVASIGIPDTLFLMLLALVVFGPRRLPEIGRQIGKLMYEFRKVSNDFKFQMEEELRASEEAERQRKLQAASQVTLDVPPQPVAESTALELGAGASSDVPTASEYPQVPTETAATADDSEAAPAVAGEVREEPRQFPADTLRVQPPVSGEVVAAQKPFRGRTSEVTTESGDEPTRTGETPAAIADEGRIGTEVQPGVDTDVSTGTERAPHHA